MDADGKQLALARKARDESHKILSDKMASVAQRIIGLERGADECQKSAIRFASKTVQARAEVGRLLLEMKGELGHGNWLAWMTKHLSLLSSSDEPASIQRLAQRRIELHIRVRDGLIAIDDARSLREAYTLAGLLPDSSRTELSSKAVDGGDDPLLVRITRISGALQSAIQQQPVNEWSPERKQVWRERLEPLANLYEQIC